MNNIVSAAAFKHTSGPWHVGGKDGTIVYAEDGYAIADAKTWHQKHAAGSAQANARLIAVAPEMLEVLLKIDAIDGSSGGHNAMIDEIKFFARAAIAKMEGR